LRGNIVLEFLGFDKRRKNNRNARILEEEKKVLPRKTVEITREELGAALGTKFFFKKRQHISKDQAGFITSREEEKMPCTGDNYNLEV